MKPTDKRYQAATKVNAISPETYSQLREVDRFWRLEDIIDSSDMVSLNQLSRGFRQQHDIEWKMSELGSPIQILKTSGICRQAEKDKEVEKFVWESDSFIVVMKRSNARGAKGTALICKGLRKHFS